MNDTWFWFTLDVLSIRDFNSRYVILIHVIKQQPQNPLIHDSFAVCIYTVFTQPWMMISTNQQYEPSWTMQLGTISVKPSQMQTPKHISFSYLFFPLLILFFFKINQSKHQSMLRLIKSLLFAIEKHYSLNFVYFPNFCFCIFFLCLNNWKARIANCNQIH
jgi:hypothetical protein